MLSVEKQMLFLLSKADQLQSQDLIRIYEKRGYSAPYIRNGLSKLKKEQYVDNPTRSTYSITESGRSYIRSINRKPMLYSTTWEGTWHLVLLSFPESERKRRDQLRADLLQTGLGLLYSGVYVSPWPYKEELSELIHKHSAGQYVTIFTGKLDHGEITSQEAEEIWSLKEVNRVYEEKLHWYDEHFEPLLQDTLNNRSSAAFEVYALELFVLFLTLGEAINELYLIDPMLPPELLPVNWRCRDILQKLSDGLTTVIDAIPSDSDYARFVK
ncbi:phenylacetic acid degradation operon negative regulatory protein PaaX [Paenibacillus sp. CCS19]|uniref:PaaX family transcriptional regulator C-terminal domain-containing protein n=1 Tax=Paenibacillus sp. CCS19 TaxID=3158387 RepID=UPI00256433E9|nr:PaaX family transcriptional regulator C-terminal domain-containing protein [Paenibacillus cellulosilyticus]GMK40580.1 phenylacetic acid degradation operon negative regulatory protein PaaX [Paenibacillus cellulosilyticus]